MVGDSLVINCTATINVMDADLLTLAWTGPGGVITNDSRVTISTSMEDHDVYTSTLDFSYLTESDGGNYTCNVQFFNVSGSGSTEIYSPGCEFVMIYICAYYMYCLLLWLKSHLSIRHHFLNYLIMFITL